MNPENVCVKVKSKEREWRLSAGTGKKLSELLQEHHIGISHPCQGNGTCGKCKVKVVSGESEVTDADAANLTQEELKQNFRLACRITVKKNLEIEVTEMPEEEMVIESVPAGKKLPLGKEFFIAIDIGTTTLAMALVEEETGQVSDTYTSLNHQRMYGADVISRIQASEEGKDKELKRVIEEDLWKGICFLTSERKKKDKNLKECRISRVVLVGNTSMFHFLMGYSCNTLGKAPFYSEHLKWNQCTLKECITLGKESCYAEVPVTFLPGISVFVGADIVAGVLKCPEFESDKICLLLDLGTNGEMVLGNRKRLLSASAAAGPAFEGGNIICGMASIPGAVSKVKIQNSRAIVHTIGNVVPPRGICGSGLISLMAELKRNKLLDENGNLAYPYDKKGYSLWTCESGEKIALYQQDVRRFQMAKAAIRAGVEILMENYGCMASEVCQVYLAGGFGKGIDVEDAIETGILPKDFWGKVLAIGNGALAGGILFGRRQVQERVRAENIVSRTQHISLAGEKEFENKYIEYMKF